MGTEYKVLKITQGVRLSDEGGTETYYRHQIKTEGGVILTIDIAEVDFTKEKAAPILAAKAKTADAILKG